MTAERKNKLMLRWSIFTAGLIALFWTIWFLTAGEVPSSDMAGLTTQFSISRWFDIFLGPIYSVLVVGFVCKVRNIEDKRYKEDIIFGLRFGLAFGLAFGLLFGFAFGLVYGLVYGLVVGLVVSLVFGLAVGLGFGLAFGLAVGLGFGLVFGLAFGLVYGLALGLAYVLLYIISKMAKPTVVGLKSWLTAK